MSNARQPGRGSRGISEPSPDLAGRVADLLDPPEHPYVDNPVGWVSEELGEHLWSAQADVAESVRDHRFTAVQSCHGAGKSFTASRIAAWWMETHPPGEAFVVSTAPTFKQVRAVLWREIGRAHRKGDLVGRLNQTEWWIGPEIVGYGAKPADWDPDAFQGIHARYVLVLIDEAAGVPHELWDAAESLLTNDDCRLLAIGNPTDPTSAFADSCTPGSGYNTLRISAFDTPNFTDEEVPERLKKLLVGHTWVEERRRKWGESNPWWIARVLGEFPEGREDALIPIGWIRAAQDRELEPSAPHILGGDIARYGSDKTAIYRRHGPTIRKVWVGGKLSTMASSGRIAKAHREDPADAIHIDEIGVGSGVVDRLEEQGLPVRGINVGNPPRDKEQFKLLRDELFWALRDRFESGDIDLDPADEDLAGELAAIRYTHDSRGRVKVESKDEMKARGLASPDHADTVALAFAPTIRRRKPKAHTGKRRRRR